MSAINARSTGFEHGAEFLKVALQVNPYQYLVKNGKRTKYTTETAYNKAIVEALVDNEVDAIAVVDHFSIADSLTLLSDARSRGIVAFPGFEAETSDGVHVLCIFDEKTDQKDIERCIGACKSAKGLTLIALLEKIDEWNAVAITAHITTEKKGLLGHLKGRPRQEAWNNPKHIAASLSVAYNRVSDRHKRIISGSASGYKRDHPVAILYAADVSSPAALGRKTSWTWARMSSATVQGLRHAFLDPDSRIRLPENRKDQPTGHIRSVSWTGGFLDGVTLRLNPALNVVIGPRGVGKSTVLESIRFALGLTALGTEAQAAHEGFVREVLGSGAEVVLEVFDPSTRSSLHVTRPVSGEPTVSASGGLVTSQDPQKIAGPIQVLGQHEVAELAKQGTDRTQLLRRFIPKTTPTKRSRSAVAALLTKNRKQLIQALEDQDQLAERLEARSTLEARIVALKKAGIEDTLDREAESRKEEPLFERASEAIEDIESQLEDLQPIDATFLEETEVSGLPSESDLTDIRLALEKAEGARSKSATRLKAAIQAAKEVLDQSTAKRDERIEADKKNYLKKLRKLKQDQIDGEEYLSLTKSVASLDQDAKKQEQLQERVASLRDDRSSLLDEWRQLQQRDYDQLVAATRIVNNRLTADVRTTAQLRGHRQSLKDYFTREVGGQLNKILDGIDESEVIDPVELAAAIRAGPDELKEYLGWHGRQAENVVSRLEEEQQLFRLEELWLEPTTSIELNVGGRAGKHVWRDLNRLSTGQKATAILLVVLLDSGTNAPLIIDQPEDDLDSDFIADAIVPKLRSEKDSRQFILSTHNPNIPVLGDAEQVVRLTAEGEAATGGRAEIQSGHTGSMDVETVKTAVAALEGGRHAFERRRRRYGY